MKVEIICILFILSLIAVEGHKVIQCYVCEDCDLLNDCLLQPCPREIETTSTLTTSSGIPSTSGTPITTGTPSPTITFTPNGTSSTGPTSSPTESFTPTGTSSTSSTPSPTVTLPPTGTPSTSTIPLTSQTTPISVTPTPSATSATTGTPSTSTLPPTIETPPTSPTSDTTTTDLEDKTTTTEVETISTTESDGGTFTTLPSTAPSLELQPMRNFSRVSRATSVSYHCFSIDVVENYRQKTKRGCVRVPEEQSGCEVLRRNYGCLSKNCRVCSSDGCNCNGALRGSLLAVITITLCGLLSKRI